MIIARLHSSVEHLAFTLIVDGAGKFQSTTEPRTQEKVEEVTSDFWSEENKENGIGKSLT